MQYFGLNHRKTSLKIASLWFLAFLYVLLHTLGGTFRRGFRLRIYQFIK
jgi:hypothetical protein